MTSLNQHLFLIIFMAGHRNGFLAALAIFFAQWMPYLLVFAFLLLAYYQKGWRHKVYLFAEGALAVILSRGIVTELIRFFYHHPRPFSVYGLVPLFAESGWSFPSGHAAWFFALATTVWFANRKWGWWFFAFTILNGWARIYAGVHWPMDILGGALVGIASAWGIHWLLARSKAELDRALPLSDAAQ